MIQKNFCSALKMGVWNVGGLISKQLNKTTDPKFLEQIDKFDILFLVETHLGYEHIISKIGPFYCHLICRPITKANNRYFGGLAVLCKHEIRPYIKILKNTNPNYQWVKLEKQFFGFNDDLFVCCVYDPPETSSYTKGLDHGILEIVEKDISYYQNYGNILLCGDFNARASAEIDYIQNDSSNYIPVYQSYRSDKQILDRKCKDNKLDARGKDLIDVCISNQLRILNGRVLGDTFGNYTCYTPNGASTVDYVLVSESILNQILYFKVCNFIPLLSDCHCLLQWSLSAKYCMVNDEYAKNEYITNEIPLGYIWTDESPFLFQNALESPDVKEKIDNFLKTDKYDTQKSVNDAAVELSDILLLAAEKSLKTRKPKKKGKQKHKKYFDSELYSMRKNLTDYGQIYTRYPNDPKVRGHYYKLLKNYSKARKAKYKSYKQSLLQQIEALHDEDPKQYWRLIDELKGAEKTDNDTELPASTWHSHFEKLNNPKPEFKDSIQLLEEKLKDLEKEKHFTELDGKITEAEITAAISEIKANKSPGLDRISNHMLKSSQNHIISCLHKLFNNCFTFGHYPEPWSKGYITPIHKSGDMSDPNNYRGITITNCLGKLFNKILDNRLIKYLDKNKIINSCQMGFTRKAGTSDHMFILKTILDKYCHTKEDRVYASFVDFQKAFDTVIHTGIKIKLIQNGISSHFYNIIKNMYSQSESCVKIKDRATNFFPNNVGVKQGDNLSPNLFKIFINDLPKYLLNSSDPVFINNNPVHCLLYADDVILLSTSLNGLQDKLNILKNYCDDWCLNINVKKTKALIFNKAGRHIKQNLLFNGNKIECVSEYKYLGIIFCASGSFSVAQRELYNKGLKAYYKLRRDFFSFGPSIKNSLHIFDHTIKPILMYGSEVWGYFNPNAARFKKEDMTIDQIHLNLLSEKLHIKFCKYILGVNKKATNLAVLSELGRFPIHFDIVKSILRFWHRIENLNGTFPLLQDAYTESKRLFNANIPSWYGSVNFLMDKIPGLNILSNISKYKFKYMYKKIIFQCFEQNWIKQMQNHSDGKLCSYTYIKTKFCLEKYLTVIKSFEQRRNFTRLRISNHRLQIEKGRYQDVPRQNRLCPRCPSGEIDDEKHFLFSCTTAPNERNNMIVAILNICPKFNSLNQDHKLLWLLNNENMDILNSVCKLIIESKI